ncbi:cyclic nucleotide-binding domain-containing protein [Microvirga tunisiensis]|uniref:Cyclic nucleotide-binding domain-containing protein n=2 Tax=Pannonibacter tanglangensis TaxID=2750084 RepID=A0ABW9ZM06_9HYPH|nr:MULTISPECIES: Crp/Fnr family transcriptional regulator [unclassified Pannonibacter]NBN64927.1 cyclic nucleotide-binding domain-containing protein [Pannonibacter sp. XCT-34]NBN79436.1 cyclic nucleotide-binding domain-containing protein [Pannonibacter sp. XCT-53]
MSDADTLKKQKLLDQSFIFQALDEASRRDLAQAAHTRRHASGEVIFTMGAPGHSLMAIAEGHVRISMLSPTAREVTLADLGPGEVFGEIALLDGRERSADARALTNCTLVVLERSALFELLQRSPKLSIRLIELLCERIRRSDERMMEIAFLDLPPRLARMVLRVTVAAPGSEARPLPRLSLSQTEIANMIGSSRENVNRCLRKWQKAGLIDLKDGWLVILDRAGLARVASLD